MSVVKIRVDWSSDFLKANEYSREPTHKQERRSFESSKVDWKRSEQMSSDADRNQSAGEKQTTSVGKEEAHGESNTSATGNVPSAGHQTTGVEKLVESGGSGGVPLRNDHGYEAMAHH